MKKHLIILAGLTIMFGANAAEAPDAAASGPQSVHGIQARSSKFSACRKDALDHGLKGQDLKEAILACTK